MIVMNFEFATAARIVFGKGKIDKLPELVQEFGSKALIVTGRNAVRADSLRRNLSDSSIQTDILCVSSEPTVDLVREGAQAARKCDFIIGFGGGSGYRRRESDRSGDDKFWRAT